MTDESKDEAAKLNGALLTIEEAAKHLGVSVDYLRKTRREGTGPAAIKLTGTVLRFKPVDLDAWIEGFREAQPQ